MIAFLKKYWITTTIILIVLILCFMDTTQLPKAPTINFDKFVHIVMFSGVSGVIFFDNSLYLRFPISNKRIFWGSFFFPVMLGGLIEIMQEKYLAPTRSGDWFDFLFDVVGTLIGLSIIILINRRLPFTRKT